MACCSAKLAEGVPLEDKNHSDKEQKKRMRAVCSSSLSKSSKLRRSGAPWLPQNNATSHAKKVPN